MAENRLNPDGFDWDKLPGESDTAFEAFGYYLRMPAETRSVGGAYYAKRGIPRPGGKNAPGGWRAWYAEFMWKARAESYDHAKGTAAPAPRGDKIDGALRKVEKARYRELTDAEKQRRDAIAKVAERTAGLILTDDELDWAEQRRIARADDLDLSRRLIAKGREMLDVALIKRRVIPADPKNGRPETHIFEPAKWSFKTMAELLQIAVQIRRLAAELPTKIADDDTKGGSDEDAMFAATIGQLEATLPAGIVPAMPVDVTRRPEPSRPGADEAASVNVPNRLRPG